MNFHSGRLIIPIIPDYIVLFLLSLIYYEITALEALNIDYLAPALVVYV